MAELISKKAFGRLETKLTFSTKPCFQTVPGAALVQLLSISNLEQSFLMLKNFIFKAIIEEQNKVLKLPLSKILTVFFVQF